jgi:hypothetical protein
MLEYDKAMKYVVDIDFYTNYLSENNWMYIPDVLINVGIHSSQVTKYTFGFSEYQFKEGVLMLLKKDDKYFKNPVVFDGWWRLIRNFQISSIEIFNNYSLSQSHFHAIRTMINIQSYISKNFLRIGVLSKFTMLFSYLKYLLKKS